MKELPRIFRQSWSDLSLPLRKKTHAISEALLGARWIRYGGHPDSTCDGNIEALIVHPCDFCFYHVSDNFLRSEYIWDDGKYPRNDRRVLQIPEEMTAQNLAEWTDVQLRKCKTREFSPATHADDALLMEALIKAKDGDLWKKYTDALCNLVGMIDSETFHDGVHWAGYKGLWNLLHASPEQRLEAAYQVVVIDSKPK